MKSCTATVVALLLGFGVSLVSGQTVVLTIDDGVDPADDAETQANKQVQIFCGYNGIGLAHTRALLYSTDGNTWEPVVLSGHLQGDWNTDGYSASEVTGTDDAQLTFTIKVSAMKDEGHYKCELFTGPIDEKVVDDSDTKVLVIFAKTQSVQVEGTTDNKFAVVAGDSQVITCTAFNGSMPRMDLLVAGELVLSEMQVREDPDGVYTAEGTQTFTVAQNGNKLTCSASVKTFTDPVIGQATLQITAKPTISCDPLSREAAESHTVEYTCFVDGIPLPTPDKVTWTALSDGLKLRGNENNPDQGLKSVASETEDNKLKVVLTVTVMATRREESFTIQAVNSRNIAAESVTVKLQKPGETGGVKDDPGSASALTAGLSTLLLLGVHLFL